MAGVPGIWGNYISFFSPEIVVHPVGKHRDSFDGPAEMTVAVTLKKTRLFGRDTQILVDEVAVEVTASSGHSELGNSTMFQILDVLGVHSVWTVGPFGDPEDAA